MSDRENLARAFLCRAGFCDADREPLAGDASARRYERLSRPGGRTAILMDAPGDDGNTIDGFLHIAAFLSHNRLSAPEIFVADPTHGFAVLEDFGDGLFAHLLKIDSALEEPMYAAAIDVLVELQRKPAPAGLSAFSPDTMARMIEPVFDWYCEPIDGRVKPETRKGIQRALETVLRDVLSGRRVTVLRDYHAENLFWLPERDGLRRVGLIDFQDALLGDPVYDVVSLLQDARRDVAAPVAKACKARFCRATGLDERDFEAAFAAIGLQRNLRILGIFARLSLDQGKTGYVELIPRVWRYVINDLQHPALRPVADALTEILPDPSGDALKRLRGTCTPAPTQ